MICAKALSFERAEVFREQAAQNQYRKNVFLAKCREQQAHEAEVRKVALISKLLGIRLIFSQEFIQALIEDCHMWEKSPEELNERFYNTVGGIKYLHGAN